MLSRSSGINGDNGVLTQRAALYASKLLTRSCPNFGEPFPAAQLRGVGPCHGGAAKKKTSQGDEEQGQEQEQEQDSEEPEFSHEQLHFIIDMVSRQCAEKAGLHRDCFCRVAGTRK